MQSRNKRVLILGNSHLVVFKFRGELIEALVKQKYDVWVSFPNGPFGEGENTARKYGCHFIESYMERRSANPIKDWKIISNYVSIIKQIKPMVVLAYTVKPDVYGGIVCKLLDVPFIPNITGLGKALDEKGIVQKITIALYKSAVKDARCVFFQNDSDKKFFDEKKIRYKKGLILPGSGVNLKQYEPLLYPKDNEPVRFIYVARVMKAKGIEEYLDAAHTIKKIYPKTEFHICGYCEEDYKDILEEKEKCGEIIYHGLVDDIQLYEKMCHCVVLPSFHPEGISNVLLEGAACARPLITTDHAGCRETVTDGITGFIVRQRDSKDLTDKMLKFIEMPNEDRRKMGEEGRKKIEKEFDRKIVVDCYMKEIRELGRKV